MSYCIPSIFLSLLVLTTTALSAQVTVRGTVADAADATPLIGVTVLVVGGTGGTVTDVDGRYEIVVGDAKDKLRFTYIGMTPRTLSLNGRTVVDLTLEEAANDLSQVVVTGYRGAQEVKDLVGSVAEINAEELVADRPVESFEQLLEGRIAGVRVETVTGEPGLPVKVEIRGQSSLPTAGQGVSASTQPLYILDGVPLYDALETNDQGEVGGGNNTTLNPLSFINPDDIASITVLKDASATALYGADASNGVILITTKSGQQGPTRINLSVNYGTGRPINEIKFLNTAQYLELARETLLNDGLNPEEAGPSDVETDWRSLVQQNPVNTDVDLSLSGGAAGVTYRLSAGYSEVESVHKGNGLKQANLNLNLNFPINKKLTLGTSMSGAFQRKDGLRSFDTYSFLPNLPVRNPDGSFYDGIRGFLNARPNPVALLEQNENEQNSTNVNGRLTLTYEPASNLTFRLLGGLDQQQRNQFQYRSMLNASGASRDGFLIRADNRNFQWITNGQVVWTPKLGDKHHLNSLLGGEAQRQQQFKQVTQGTQFPFDDLRRLAVLKKEDINAAETTFIKAKASTYGEMAYNFDYRYYLKINARRDANSIFGGDRQADIFGAIGTAWNFSNEPALVDRLPFGIDYGKLRSSYGVTGNSRLGVYTTNGVYQQRFADENYGGQLPASVTLPANDLLGWERKLQTNVGLDLGWRDGRFKLTAEYYSNRTIDGLFTFDTPRESGFTSILANAVSLRNWGYELTLTYRTAQNNKWRYSSSFNASRNRNRLLAISNEEIPARGSATAFLVGRDINLIYGIPFVDVNPETGEARYRLPDGSLTSTREDILNPFNFVPIGRSAPDVYGGWHQHLDYGAVGLTLQINYSYGGDITVDRLTFTDGQQIGFNNQSVNQLDRWQQPGDIATVPRLSVENGAVSRSSRYVYRNNFIQFGSVNINLDLTALGYLPDNWRTARAFLLVNNLGYLYGEDRRENRNGVREYRFTFPQQRSLTMGLKLGW
jgi:TonB-linked SusC/RagA family outer membrane protein